MAGVAGAGQLVERDGEFGAASGGDRLFQFLDRRIDVGLDHVGDRNAVTGRELPFGVFQALLDLVNFIGREVPVAVLPGKP